MTPTRCEQPPIRSALYVPGQKLEWMLKAPKYGSDALILDIEDAVAPDQKPVARTLIQQALAQLGQAPRPRLFVRINSFDSGLAELDLEAIVRPGLFGIYLPKVHDPEEVKQADTLLNYFEARAGMPRGSTIMKPLLESANGLRQTYEIAMASPRVAYLGSGATGIGDFARAIGYRETESHLETLYLRSKVILDARAAGITNPIGGMWPVVDDLAGLRAHAEAERNLGHKGMNAIHPSHVPIINEVFSPTAQELEHLRGLIAAVEGGQARGSAAVIYGGRMVDIAHLKHAREQLSLSAELVGSGSGDGLSSAQE